MASPSPDRGGIAAVFIKARTEGIRDFADILAGGGEVIEPIGEEAMFKRVFLSRGVPTWPSGLQLDPSNLHLELRQLGQLSMPAPAG